MKTNQCLNMILALGVGAALLVPRGAQACHEVTVCVNFALVAEDLGVGDLPEGFPVYENDKGITAVPARSVRVTLVPPPPEFPQQTLLDAETGCFTFSTQFASGHKLFVHPEAFLGDNYKIRVAGFDLCTDVRQELGLYADPHEPAPVGKPRKIYLQNLVEGASASFLIPDKQMSPLFRLFAWVTWIIHRFENHEDIVGSGLDARMLSSDREARLFLSAQPVDELHEDCKLLKLGGIGTREEIYLRPELIQKRFTIGHEVGHWLQANWVWKYLGGAYKWTGIDEPCQFVATGSNSLHGLRSAELGPEAMLEGFAHFFSSWIFDDHGEPDARFKYYKTVDTFKVPSYSRFVDIEDYEVSLMGAQYCDEDPPFECHVFGGTMAWVENQCPADWDWYNCANTAQNDLSSELDWMRFFWQFSSPEVTSPSPVASMAVILDALEGTDLEMPNWPELRSALDLLDSSYLGRFDELSGDNGVYNEEDKSINCENP